MCNSLHQDSKPIPTKGFGWKIFTGDGPLFIHSSDQKEYLKDQNGWIFWGSSYGEGFTFFLDKSEATKLLLDLVHFNPNVFSDSKIKKVKYNFGLGTHPENNIVSWNDIYQIALCKSFKIMERE